MENEQKRQLLLALQEYYKLMENREFVDYDDYSGVEYYRLTQQDFNELNQKLESLSNIIACTDYDGGEAKIFLTNEAMELVRNEKSFEQQLKELDMVKFSELYNSRNNLVIHTNTLDKATALLSYLDKLGIVWNNGDKLTSYTNYENNYDKTCYSINKTKKTITYGDTYYQHSFLEYDDIIFDDFEINENVETQPQVEIPLEPNKELDNDSIIKELLGNNDYINIAVREKFEKQLDDLKTMFGDDLYDIEQDKIVILLNNSNRTWKNYKAFLNEDNYNLSNDILEELYDLELTDEQYYICDNCGDMVSESDIHRVQGDYDYVCDNCYENGYTCDNCGDWFPDSDDMRRVNTYYGEEYWCDSCLDNDAFYCNGYDEYYKSNDYDCCEVNGYIYSLGYAEEYFHYCEECGEWYDDDDYDFDEEMCRDCADSRYGDNVWNYHHRPAIKFYGKIPYHTLSNQYHIGIELEMQPNNYSRETEYELTNKIWELVDKTNYEIYFNRDGSIGNGFELIIQPHTWEAFKQMPWKEILQLCKDYGYTSHDNGNCGLHMHISRKFFGKDAKTQDRAIEKLLNFYDCNYNEIVKVSRRNSEGLHWCRKYFNTLKQDMAKKTTIAEYKKITKDKYAWGRYQAVNNQNDNTVEFRIMRGTLNYDSFMACLDFTYRVAMNSKKVVYRSIADNSVWLKGISDNTKAYLQKRHAFLDVVGE